MLFLARSGLFGRRAQRESQLALEDWAGNGRLVLPLLATVILGLLIAAVIILVT